MNTDLPSTNPRVRISEIRVLSDNWFRLNRVDFDYLDSAGRWSQQQREAYDRGNGATILLYDETRQTVLLTRQFRLPAYLNGHPNGMLIEAPAGLLDEEDAHAAILRETAEETGYHLDKAEPIFELFMSPGSVTERVAFFTASYRQGDRADPGGGVESEGEEIEVLELHMRDAIDMIATGEIADGKTVLLLQWAQLNLTEQQRTSA